MLVLVQEFYYSVFSSPDQLSCCSKIQPIDIHTYKSRWMEIGVRLQVI